MNRRRYPLLTAATFTLVISALPVKADHHEPAPHCLEDKHHLKVPAVDKNLCIHEQSNQKIVPNLSMVQLLTGVDNPAISTEPSSVSQ